MAFRNLAVVLALVPSIAAADTDAYNAGYKVGAYVGRLVGTYGVYLAVAAVIGVVGLLWFRRTRAKARRPEGSGS